MSEMKPHGDAPQYSPEQQREHIQWLKDNYPSEGDVEEAAGSAGTSTDTKDSFFTPPSL